MQYEPHATVSFYDQTRVQSWVCNIQVMLKSPRGEHN